MEALLRSVEPVDSAAQIETTAEELVEAPQETSQPATELTLAPEMAEPVVQPAPIQIEEPQVPEPVAEMPVEPEPVIAIAEKPEANLDETMPAPRIVMPAPVSPISQQSLEMAPELPPAAENAQNVPDIDEAQKALYGGQLDTAVVYYEQIIRAGVKLEDTIHNLREALYQYPVDISIWQLLGDAYLHSNCIQEALDAYTKAEQLIR
jgi:hypothetical protein